MLSLFFVGLFDVKVVKIDREKMLGTKGLSRKRPNLQPFTFDDDDDDDDDHDNFC